jgi:hypothetical protein
MLRCVMPAVVACCCCLLLLPAVQITLGIVDAAYSGDWSRIGAISKGELQLSLTSQTWPVTRACEWSSSSFQCAAQDLAGYMCTCLMCRAAVVFADTELLLQQVVWVLLGVKALCGVGAAAVAQEAGRGAALPFVKVRSSCSSLQELQSSAVYPCVAPGVCRVGVAAALLACTCACDDRVKVRNPISRMWWTRRSG